MGTTLRNVQPLAATSPIDIRFEDSRIASITESPTTPPPGDDVIDGGGKIVASGFFNTHTHLAMVLFRGLADDVPLQVWLEDHIWPIENKLRAEDVYWCTLLGLAEGIRGGTIGFADMYFHCDEIARAADEAGVRLLLSPGMAAPSMDEGGAAKLDATTHIVERWHGKANGRIRGALSPHALYTCGEDLWRATIERATHIDVPIHTHVSETRSEVEAWREQTGASPVAHLEQLGAFDVPFLAAHCVHVNEDDIAILADRGVHVAHCPKSNAKLGSGIAPLRAMLEAGVKVALGTDGAASNNRLDMIEEMRTAWILQRALHEDPMRPSADEILAMAATSARALFGLEEEALAVGSRADLILIDRGTLHATPAHDPLSTIVFAANALDVTDVLVNGNWVMRNRELRTIDVERVRFEVEGLLRRHGN